MQRLIVAGRGRHGRGQAQWPTIVDCVADITEEVVTGYDLTGRGHL